MHPPGSQQPYPPPAGGQNYAPYPSQPYPPYQYPPANAPPQKPGGLGGMVILIVTIVVVAAVVLMVVMAGMLVVWMQQIPENMGGEEPSLYITVEPTTGDRWVVSVNRGSKPATDVHMQMLNSTTGAKTVDKPLISLIDSDSDGTFHDNNGNSKLDAGDTVLIKRDGGNAVPGCKVQFTVGTTIVGGPLRLP